MMTKPTIALKLFGKFQLIVKNVKTGKVTDTGWIDNLVLNSNFDNAFIPTGSFFTYINLGTGSVVPTLADTSLDNFLVNLSVGAASSSLAGASTDFVDPIYSTSAGWESTFALGAVVGNISEIGLSRGNNSDYLTRALITDGVGDPTTITLGVDDILTVNYRMGYEMDTSHAAGAITVDFDGSNIDLTAKWMNLGKGALNLNGMNGQTSPQYPGNAGYFRVVDVLPSDPLSDPDGGATAISYLSPTPVNTGSTVTATGSTFEVKQTLVSELGQHTGDWNGVTIGPAVSTPSVLFAFDTTFTKLANQKVTITVSYLIQRA